MSGAGLNLACISPHLTAKARDKIAMTSLRLLAVLDVPSSTPARAKRLAPRPGGPLTHFASPRGEICRLEPESSDSASLAQGETPRRVRGSRRVQKADQLNGAPGRTRTCGLLLRRQTLYPAELRAPRVCLILVGALSNVNLIRGSHPAGRGAASRDCPRDAFNDAARRLRLCCSFFARLPSHPAAPVRRSRLPATPSALGM